MNKRPKTLAALGSTAVLGVVALLGMTAGLVMRVFDLITGRRENWHDGDDF